MLPDAAGGIRSQPTLVLPVFQGWLRCPLRAIEHLQVQPEEEARPGRGTREMHTFQSLCRFQLSLIFVF